MMSEKLVDELSKAHSNDSDDDNVPEPPTTREIMINEGDHSNNPVEIDVVERKEHDPNESSPNDYSNDVRKWANWKESLVDADETVAQVQNAKRDAEFYMRPLIVEVRGSNPLVFYFINTFNMFLG